VGLDGGLCLNGESLVPKVTRAYCILSEEEHGLCGMGMCSFAVSAKELRAGHVIGCLRVDRVGNSTHGSGDEQGVVSSTEVAQSVLLHQRGWRTGVDSWWRPGAEQRMLSESHGGAGVGGRFVGEAQRKR
jgi:hypothetical protein